MPKITLKEFEDFTDLFVDYYKNKSIGKQDGWIEKRFKKYPSLKNIWKKFDTHIADIEKSVDRTAIPYLKSQGIDVNDIK
jgi:hypothetical protein